MGLIFEPRRRIEFRRAGTEEEASQWGDERDRWQTHEGGCGPLCHPRIPHHSTMPASTPLPTVSSFNDVRGVVEGGSSMLKPCTVVQGSTALHGFCGRRPPIMSSPLTCVCLRERSIQGEDGWQREGARGCNGLGTPGEGFSGECSPFVIVSTLTIIQDYFFSCNPHKESTNLRRFPPPFNPLRLIK